MNILFYSNCEAPRLPRTMQKATEKLAHITIAALSCLALYSVFESKLEKGVKYFDTASALLAGYTLLTVIACKLLCNETPILHEHIGETNDSTEIKVTKVASGLLLLASGALCIDPYCNYGLRIPSLMIALSHVMTANFVCLNRRSLYGASPYQLWTALLIGLIAGIILKQPADENTALNPLLRACRESFKADPFQFLHPDCRVNVDENRICMPVTFTHSQFPVFGDSTQPLMTSVNATNIAAGFCQRLNEIPGLTKEQTALGEGLRKYEPLYNMQLTDTNQLPKLLAPIQMQVNATQSSVINGVNFYKKILSFTGSGFIEFPDEVCSVSTLKGYNRLRFKFLCSGEQISEISVCLKKGLLEDLKEKMKNAEDSRLSPALYKALHFISSACFVSTLAISHLRTVLKENQNRVDP